MATLEEIRAKYPQYADMDDQSLVDGLHKRFYADMPLDQFYQKVGYTKQPTTAEVATDAGKQLVYGVNRGINAMAGLPGWLMAEGAQLVGVPKETADKFRFQNNPVSDYLTAGEKPTTTAGKYADAVGQNIPGAVAATGTLLRAASRVPQAAPAIASMWDDIVAPYAARPTAAVATDAAATVGASVGQQAAEDAGFGAGGQMIGALAGGIAPVAGAQLLGGAARALDRATHNIRNPQAGANERFLANLGDTSLDELSSSIAVGSTRANEAMSRATLDILGDEMVRTNGNQRQAVANTIDRIVNETGATPTAARDRVRRVMAVNEDSDLMLGEYPAVVSGNAETRMMRPQNVADEDAGRIQASGVQDLYDYLGNSASGQSTQNVRNSIMDRMSLLRDTMRERLMNISPNQQTIQDADNLIARMTQQARQEYDAVYNAPGGTAVNYGLLHGLLQRSVDRHINRMAGRSGEQRQALQSAIDELFVTTPNGQRLIMPSLQQLQDMRGAIRGMITRNRNAGNNHIVNTLQPLYDDVTRIMERASPQWRVANRRWADMRIGETARELGEAFAERSGPRFREQLREFDRLAPEMQDLVRIELAQKWIDKIDNAGDTHDLAKLFSTPHLRAMVRRMFGDEAAVDFARAVRDQRVATMSRNMLSNSATHRRGMNQTAQDAEVGMVANLDNANIGGVRQWLVGALTNVLRERRNRPLSELVTTPMSNGARVAERLARLRETQARLQRFNAPRVRTSPVPAAFNTVATPEE